MTREDAIEILRKNRPTSDPRPCGMELCDAVDMAISALRQQEQLDKVSQGSSQDKPLTMDELRKMDGEPVYSVEITGREEWLFRRDGGFADMYGEFTSDDFMVWDNYGKFWWCYRQKPEEGTV